jgi:HEAT repeat protein
MKSCRILVVALALVAVPTAAMAHGGSMRAPGGQTPAGDVPPGTADPSTPTTRWETWWAANKESFLRLGEHMRETDGPTSRGVAGDKPSPASSGESPEERRKRKEAMTREALVPMFLEALNDDSFEVRTAAAIALGKAGSPEAAPALRKACVDDPHKDVRDSAVLALGLLGRPADILFLDERLADAKQPARNRSFAAFALGLVGGEDAAAALVAFANGRAGAPSTFAHEQPPLISSVFVAMGMTGDERVLPTLRKAMADPTWDDNVRAFVVLSLGRMRDRESLAPIARILVSHTDMGMRRSAAIALGKIARADDAVVVEALSAAAADAPDEMVRQFSAVALGGIADDAIRARLEKLFDAAPSGGRPFLALALALAHDRAASPRLRAAYAKETDESVKSSYCVALGLLGDQAAAPLMERDLQDRGRIWLQGYAALGLGLLRRIESAPLLRARLAAENDPRLRGNIAVGLGLMHDPAARSFLVETLRRKDATVYERGGAAMGLGVLRLDDAVPDIADVVRDKKEQDMVRAFATVALGLVADPAAVPKLSRFAIDNNYSLSIDPLNEVLTIL